MEVHHHAHEGHGKKNWKSYFWEFLMLFLAVFCGFLAEYKLEHVIESDREKVFMKNMYEDLKSDTAIYGVYNTTTIAFENKIDSLFTLLKSEERNSKLSEIYFVARKVTTDIPQLFPNKRTYTQMKNSGFLRLIHNQKVADEISDYYLSLEKIEIQNGFIMNSVSAYMNDIGEIFDASVFFKIRKEGKAPAAEGLKLLTEEPVVINKYLMKTQYLWGSRKSQNNEGLKASANAKKLLEVLKEEYHIED